LAPFDEGRSVDVWFKDGQCSHLELDYAIVLIQQSNQLHAWPWDINSTWYLKSFYHTENQFHHGFISYAFRSGEAIVPLVDFRGPDSFRKVLITLEIYNGEQDLIVVSAVHPIPTGSRLCHLGCWKCRHKERGDIHFLFLEQWWVRDSWIFIHVSHPNQINFAGVRCSWMEHRWGVFFFSLFMELGMYWIINIREDTLLFLIITIQVVDNDGVHAKLEKCSDVKLAAGEHQIKVMMFQAAKEVILSATYRSVFESCHVHSGTKKDACMQRPWYQQNCCCHSC
jgi:hypothetical protein